MFPVSTRRGSAHNGRRLEAADARAFARKTLVWGRAATAISVASGSIGAATWVVHLAVGWVASPARLCVWAPGCGGRVHMSERLLRVALAEWRVESSSAAHSMRSNDEMVESIQDARVTCCRRGAQADSTLGANMRGVQRAHRGAFGFVSWIGARIKGRGRNR